MLTHTNEKIAQLLATKVRVMTADQLAERFFQQRKSPLECAQRATRKLQQQGYADTWAGMVRQLPLEQPLLVWKPGDALPEFGKLAWVNHKRWRAQGPRKTRCLTSTDKAKARFGGLSRQPRPHELEHDVAVAEVYLLLGNKSAIAAEAWHHEDSLPNKPGKRPDAIIHRKEELVFVDVLGRGYSRQKIEHIWHEHRQQNLELY